MVWKKTDGSHIYHWDRLERTQAVRPDDTGNARWMRPTGGFGIGIQSAFMVTSSVTIMTQTENETVGRKITLNAPKSGGEVITEEYQLGHHGTKIEIKVPVDIFAVE